MSADEVEKLARDMIEACADPESSEGAERYAALLVRAREELRLRGRCSGWSEHATCERCSLLSDLDKLVG